jgi:hypothetical protein
LEQLVGQQMQMSPMQQQTEANAGSLQQLRSLELQITGLSDVIQQMAMAYPLAAEDARTAIQAADAMRQALTGFVVAIVSQMPAAQPSGPPFLGA